MNPEQEKARQSAEAEMKIYTPHRVIQEKCDNVAFDNAPVRIYERPYHPNQPTSPLGYPTGCETSLFHGHRKQALTSFSLVPLQRSRRTDRTKPFSYDRSQSRDVPADARPADSDSHS